MEEKKDEALEKGTISWNLNGDGVLRVDGSGKIPDCGCGNHPLAGWEDVKDRIFEIHIADGITEIGINAFKNCKNLQKVVLAGSVERIHAKAFWGCLQLTRIETSRHSFRYFFDEDSRVEAKDTVTFGIDAFYGVPWCRARFGDFYIVEGSLYATFAHDVKDLEVPEGVRVLKSFSMNFLDLDSVYFPKSLKRIEDFAFSGTRVKKITWLPETGFLCFAEGPQLSKYALADCSIKWAKSSWLAETARESWKRNMPGRERFPKFLRPYLVTRESRKAYGGFRKLKLKEKLPELPDGTLASYIVDPYELGKNLFRRIQSGKVVLCLQCRENHVAAVKSFTWNDEEKGVCEYLLYPAWEGSCLVPWRDSFTDLEDDEFYEAFVWLGSVPEDTDGLRPTQPGETEEWFCSNDRENFGGPLELELLERWLPLHPGIAVDSDEENMENDRHHRFFITV